MTRRSRRSSASIGCFCNDSLLICPAALQPFLLKSVHIVSDILINSPDAFQNNVTKRIFTAIMGSTSATVALVVIADVVILLAIKALACGKVELAAAIGTEQKPGEESLPFRFCGTAFVMGRIDPVELAKRAKYKPPAMRVRDGCYTKKSPFRYN